MKIACDRCSTKYSIDDDKVAGKVFKIRCRTCGSSIFLRGAAPASGPGAAEPEWHAVQDGRQIGPFDSGELLRRRAAGELDDASYVWREGFAEWQPLGSVDELRALSAPPSPAPRAPSPALFPTGTPERGADAGKLHGERNETSALFTLDGLAKLAGPGPAPAKPSAPVGATAGEGSGLIDIRALARTYAPAPRPGDGSPDGALAPSFGAPVPMADLPVFAPGPFAAPDVLVPAVRRRDHRLLVGLVAALGLLAICAALLLVVVFTRGGKPTVAGDPLPAAGPRVAAAEPQPQPRTASPAVVEAPPAPRPAMPAAPASIVEPATRPATTPAARPATPAARPATPAVRPTTPAARPATPAARPATPAVRPTPPAARPTTPPAAARCDQVTCIVNGYDSDCCRALQGGATPPVSATPATGRPTVPENLDRAAIAEGLGTISVKRCSGASSAAGYVKAQLKVSAAGAVTAVNVQSAPDAALSACVAEQARKGRFRPTLRGASFSYVWRF